MPANDVLDRVRQLDNATLQPVVRRVLGDDSASPKPGWTAKPIGGSVGAGTLGIFHISGDATTNSGIASWTVVAKVMDIDAEPNSVSLGTPHREVQVYESGVLDSIDTSKAPGATFRGANHFGLTKIDGLGSVLWVEDLSAAQPPPWDDNTYLEIARHIGHFNAGWEQNPPAKSSWYLGDAFTNRVEGARKRFTLISSNLDDHLVRRAMTPKNLELLNRFDEALPAVVDLLRTGPNPLGHNDAQPRNLFPIQLDNGDIETVAIDWAGVGYSPLGTDAALVVASSLTWCEFNGERGARLHSEAVNSFIEGLNEVGWKGDTALVRLAYMTGAAIRASGGLVFTARWVTDLEWKQIVTGLMKKSPEVLADHWGDVFEHVYPLFEKELAAVRAS